MSASLICLYLQTGENFYKYMMFKTFGLSKANANVSTGFLESIILSFREHYSLWSLQSFCHRFEMKERRKLNPRTGSPVALGLWIV